MVETPAMIIDNPHSKGLICLRFYSNQSRRAIEHEKEHPCSSEGSNVSPDLNHALCQLLGTLPPLSTDVMILPSLLNSAKSGAVNSCVLVQREMENVASRFHAEPGHKQMEN